MPPPQKINNKINEKKQKKNDDIIILKKLKSLIWYERKGRLFSGVKLMWIQSFLSLWWVGVSKVKIPVWIIIVIK